MGFRCAYRTSSSGKLCPVAQIEKVIMAEKKIIAALWATGAQGGGVVRAIIAA